MKILLTIILLFSCSLVYAETPYVYRSPSKTPVQVYDVASSDSDFAKLDGTNQPFTGSVSAPSYTATDGGLSTFNQGVTVNLSQGSTADDDFIVYSSDGSKIIFVDSSENSLFIGSGVVSEDYKVTFDGETNDGVITWMEDEDYFQFDDGINMGGTTNAINIDDTNGQISWKGTYLKKLTLRPNIIQTQAKISGVPTEVYRGTNVGYSMPIWSDPAAVNEQLFFRMRIPARWDGVTDPQFGIICTITGAEDVGDKFKFELSWQTTDCGGDTVMGTTDSDCYSEQTIITGGGTAYTSYCIFFTLNADDATNPIMAGEMLQGRIRRVAASANEVTNEIAIWDWAIMWPVDKVYEGWHLESNVT